MFKGKTIEELDALMAEIKLAKKAIVTQEQEASDSIIRNSLSNVKEGTSVRIVYKGEEVDALFDKLTDKRLTVIVGGAKRSILLNKVVSVA